MGTDRHRAGWQPSVTPDVLSTAVAREPSPGEEGHGIMPRVDSGDGPEARSSKSAASGQGAGSRGSSAVSTVENRSERAEFGQLRNEVLDLLSDDDMSVQEVWWAANSLFPEEALSARLAMAEDVVRRLVEDGDANLYRSPWPTSDDVPGPVGVAELEEVLRSWSTWITSEDAVLLSRRRRDVGDPSGRRSGRRRRTFDAASSAWSMSSMRSSMCSRPTERRMSSGAMPAGDQFLGAQLAVGGRRRVAHQ